MIQLKRFCIFLPVRRDMIIAHQCYPATYCLNQYSFLLIDRQVLPNYAILLFLLIKIRAGCKIKIIVPLYFSIRRMYCDDVTNSRNLPKLNDEKRLRKKSVQTLHTHLLVSIYRHFHYTRFLEGFILIILTMII
jgi:hypothetical protein